MDFGWDLFQILPFYYHSETIVIVELLCVVAKLLSADDYYDYEEVLQNHLEHIFQCYKSTATVNRKNLSGNVCNTSPKVDFNLITVHDPVLICSTTVKIDNPI